MLDGQVPNPIIPQAMAGFRKPIGALMIGLASQDRSPPLTLLGHKS